MNPLQQRRNKVNGKFLPNLNGKLISILGEVTKISSNSNSFEMRTTDNCIINVILSEPIDEPLDGWVEVRGISQGKNVVLGEHCIVLAADMFKDFDKQLYNDVLTVVNTLDNPWMNGA